MDDETLIQSTEKSKNKRKRLAAYSLAAMTAVGGGLGGLVIGAGALGAGAEDSSGSTPAPAAAFPLAGAAGGPQTFVMHAPGAPGARVDMLQIAADTIGIPVDELRTGLQANKSIAQIAQEKGVDPQKVIDALVAAHTKALDDAKAALPERVKADVERQGLPHRGPGGPGGHGGPGHHHGPRVDILRVAAEAIGITAEELRTATGDSRSIAQVAQEKGVDPQRVIDALVAAHNTMIDEQVAAGRMEQSKADELKANFPARAKEIVEQVGRPERGPGGPRGPRPDAGTPQPPAPSTTTD